MKYFRNTELAKIYNVSEKSVRNWIQAARDGKLNLELHEKDGKFWVANTRENVALLETQVERGKKYKNRRSLKILKPDSDFYEYYNQKQILDIISSLTIHHEIPTQYSYVNGGADYWDRYANRLASEEAPNILTQTVRLLDISADAIDSHTNHHQKINIVDLGPGNGLPIKNTIQRVLDEGRLNRYIAIDSSQEMLNILEANIKKWFNGKVNFEGHVIDFSHQRFDDIFADDYSVNDDEIPINLVFLLGGTLSNFKSPRQTLETINQSMGPNDLLIYSAYLDTPNTRRYFDFNTDQPNQKLRSELILGKLGIDDDLYDIKQAYDEEKHARIGGFVPKVDLLIEFKLANGVRRVELQKNQLYLFWRHWHRNTVGMIEQFDENGFELLQATKSSDQQYLVLITKVKLA